MSERHALGVSHWARWRRQRRRASLFLQLPTCKGAIIAGSFQNKAIDNAFEVEGTIGKESQRAAPRPVGKSWPIMETGTQNLTEDQCPALLYFEDGSTQQWLMVRLEEPEAATTKQ